MSTSRISIDVTPEQHRQLKALAAVKGQSIKDYVLDRTIGRGDEAKAMKELEKLLDARIQESVRVNFVKKLFGGVEVRGGTERHVVFDPVPGPGSLVFELKTATFRFANYEALQCNLVLERDMGQVPKKEGA